MLGCPFSHPLARAQDQVCLDVIRAFIAVELPPPLHDYLAELARRLLREVPLGSIRWVRQDGIHLTLKFLGQVPEERLAEINLLLEPRLRQLVPFQVQIGGLGGYPEMQRPRVVWVGARSPAGELKGLQASVETSLSEIGFSPETREYSGHLTLGRVRREATRGELKQIGEAIARMGETELRTLEVRGVALFQSELRPDGAVYTRLREWRLRESP